MISDINEFIKGNNIAVYSHQAMNTIFKLYFAEDDIVYCEQAAQEVFNEIDLLENNLSRYRPNSEISKINNSIPGEPIVVSEDTLNCLIKSVELFDLTNGVFDISLGDEIHSSKNNQDFSIIKSNSDLQHLLIDPNNYEVIITDKVSLDLGGIGKGYAADKIDNILSEWDLNRYLISCGYSTIKVSDSNDFKWPISLSNPNNKKHLCDIEFSKGSINSSGLIKGAHIINPKNGLVNNNRVASWVYSKESTIGDALSTAFMILDAQEIKNICSNTDSLSCIILEKESDEYKLIKMGNYFC